MKYYSKFIQGYITSLNMNARRLLCILLYLIALHSFAVGIALVLLPLPGLDFFGFTGYEGNFFKAQGGVFHIVMSIIYFFAGRDVDRNRILIYITLAAKLIATVFLLCYYFIFDNIWMVLVSGIGDLIMGLMVLILWRFYLSIKISGDPVV
ncbi:MAG: hypothetical protein AMS27_11700 [Bacteroides sp. SM23_62_1]|nr:MAG: hypothetical protein AMS27_11700 [Bacteroides sp. SM23_62_1]